jgi:hypothetical protein
MTTQVATATVKDSPWTQRWLDYVICSPFRLLIARIAAARAAIAAPR